MKNLAFIVCGLIGIVWHFVGKQIGLSEYVILFGAIPIGAITMAIFLAAMK